MCTEPRHALEVLGRAFIPELELSGVEDNPVEDALGMVEDLAVDKPEPRGKLSSGLRFVTQDSLPNTGLEGVGSGGSDAGSQGGKGALSQVRIERLVHATDH